VAESVDEQLTGSLPGAVVGGISVRDIHGRHGPFRVGDDIGTATSADDGVGVVANGNGDDVDGAGRSVGRCRRCRSQRRVLVPAVSVAPTVPRVPTMPGRSMSVSSGAALTVSIPSAASVSSSASALAARTNQVRASRRARPTGGERPQRSTTDRRDVTGSGPA